MDRDYCTQCGRVGCEGGCDPVIAVDQCLECQGEMRLVCSVSGDDNIECTDCGWVDETPHMYCTGCKKAVPCEEVDVGVGKVYHAVHCGWGHDNGVLNK